MNRSGVQATVTVYPYSTYVTVHPIVQTATMKICDSVLQVYVY